MTDEDRAKAAEVIGRALAERLEGREGSNPYLGHRWLADCETTVWRIIALSANDPDVRDAQTRQHAFQAAWGDD
ncbi:hypothetical protein WDV06_23460 [Streptomyces racemochromogenes]|uniref:Uncharacterized protein n=1 Tax=Streptomyces racemochromogenes TaxID=67353 RepID=A0ABW7PJB0_9ACTN